MPDDYYNEVYLPWVDSWEVQYYYLIMLAFPVLISLVQSLLYIFVFPFDTPKHYKLHNN